MPATGRLGPLAVTMGEPAGIGGEIALMAWQGRVEHGLPCFFVIDSPARLARTVSNLGWSVPIAEIERPEKAAEHFADALPVLALDLTGKVVPGKPDPANAPGVLAAIDRAVELARDGSVGAIVTGPIQKSTLYHAGFSFQGHTDYLAHLCQSKTPPIMMLATPGLRVVPVTVHLALKDAIAALTIDAIVTSGKITNQALQRDFGCERPRLAVAGLNPHAGEDGEIGREEIDIIVPAIDALSARGIDVSGPLPADGMFHAAARERYDAALCMYHDQALIPLKTLDFERGVNVTLGLDIVRTSPDHGTALDLAGSGRASASSLIAAIQLAAEIARRRCASAAGA